MKYVFYIAVLLIVILIILIKKNLSNKGKQGERSVAKVLKKIKHSKLINNLRLPLYDTITEIDHVLIGKMGIVVIETKSIGGSVSGNITDKELKHNIGTKRHKLYNPVFQNKTHTDNINHHLKKLGYKNIPIYSVVVFTDNNLKINLKGKSNTKILKLVNLKDYIKSIPISKNKINYKQIYYDICSIKENSIVKMANHNRKIKNIKNN